MNLRKIGKAYWSWRFGSSGWREVKKTYWDFRCGRSGDETRAAEQAFRQYAWWLCELKGVESTREFIREFITPKPEE